MKSKNWVALAWINCAIITSTFVQLNAADISYLNFQDTGVLGSALICRYDFTAFFKNPNVYHMKISPLGKGMHLTVTEEDDWFQIPFDSPLNGPIEVRFRMKSSLCSSSFVLLGWGDPQYFDAHHDNKWHEYSIRWLTNGQTPWLRLKPGMGPGEADIDWIEVRSLRLHPLAVKSVQTTESYVRMEAVNNSTSSLHLLSPEVRTVLPGEKIVVQVPNPSDAEPQVVKLRIRAENYPDLQRTVFTAPNKLGSGFISLSSDGIAVRLAANGSCAHVFLHNRLVAQLAPLIRQEDKVVHLQLLTSDSHTAHFQAEGIDLQLKLSSSSIALHVKSEHAVEAPIVRLKGVMQEAVFPGLEYLQKGESSSSDRDVLGNEHIRFAPDPALLTSQMIACVTDLASMALMWTDTSLQPTFASPDVIDGYDNEHRFSLCGKVIDATLRVTDDTKLSSVLEKTLLQQPWPTLEFKRPSEMSTKLSIFALTQGSLKSSAGWIPSSRPSAHIGWHADIASALWRLTGWTPPEVKPSVDVFHDDVIFFVTGNAEQWRRLRSAEVTDIENRQRSQGDFSVTQGSQREYTSVGQTARLASSLLTYARFTGDRKALDAGLRAIHYASAFTVPAGAQTWELEPKMPDVLAAAYLVCDNILAHEITGEKNFVSEAHRWALAGVTFVYSWNPTPGSLYAVVPALGASYRQSPVWFGRAVPWVAAAFSYSLARLAPYDRTIDWKHFSRGIAAWVDSTRLSSGPLAGCMPDVCRIDDHRSEAPYLLPYILVQLDSILAGGPEGLFVVVVKNKTVAAPFPVVVKDGMVVIHGRKKTTYQYLLNGGVRTIKLSSGADQVNF